MSRYDKGARAERRAREELEEAGWLVVRSAGSKGLYDLWALKILLVQVKSTEKPQAWTAELEQMLESLPRGPGVERQLWCWAEGEWDKHTV